LNNTLRLFRAYGTGRLFIGENVVSNGLVIIDTYNKIYNNPHECIIADSGSGKSFRIKTDAIRHVPYRGIIQ